MPIQLKSEALPPPRKSSVWHRRHAPEPPNSALPAAGSPPAATVSTADSNGGAMFRTRCAGCHGPDARGYLGPDLTSVWAAGSTDDRLFDIVRRGIPGTEMTPADPLRVNDRDIWHVLAYLRTLSAVTT